MIAKIVKHATPESMTYYNTDKTKVKQGKAPKASLIAHQHMLGLDSHGIIKTLSLYNEKRPSRSDPNLHIMLNFHKDDTLSNNAMSNIVTDYLTDMGLGEQPYAAFRHEDARNPHVHIVTTRIDQDGKFISDSNDFRRSVASTERIEKKYKITIAKESIELEKDPDKARSLKTKVERAVQLSLEDRPKHLKEFEHALMRYEIGMSITPKGGLAFYDLHDRKRRSITSKSLHLSEIGKLWDLVREEPKVKVKYLNEVYKKVNDHINSRSDNSYERLDASLALKGIEITLRAATDERPNSYEFKDVETGFTYTDQELGLREIIKELSLKPLGTGENVNEVRRSRNTKIKRSVKGRIHSVIDNLDKGSPIPLDDFSLMLRKKGLELLTHRKKTGEEIGKVFGVSFKDYFSKRTFKGSELGVSFAKLAPYLLEESLWEVDENLTKQASVNTAVKDRSSNNESLIDILTGLNQRTVIFHYKDEEELLKKRRKKKRKR